MGDGSRRELYGDQQQIIRKNLESTINTTLLYLYNTATVAKES
jgi:hypothetical protein